MQTRIIILRMPGADGQAGGGGNTYGIGPQAIIGAASGAIGMGIQRLGVNYDYRKQREQQKKLNEQQIEFNDRMSRMQQQYGLEMWEKTGYGAQVDQMKKAGINPALMYGMGGGGGQTANAGMGGSAPGAQDPNTRGATGGMMGMGLQSMAQLALLKAQKENIEADTENKRADVPVKSATVPNIEADTKNKGKEYSKLEAEIQNIAQDTMKKVQEVNKGRRDNDIGDATKEQQIETIKQTLAEKIAGNELLRAKLGTEQEIKKKVTEEITLLKNEVEWQNTDFTTMDFSKLLRMLIVRILK